LSISIRLIYTKTIDNIELKREYWRQMQVDSSSLAVADIWRSRDLEIHDNDHYQLTQLMR